MTFRERPVGQPEALRAWFYPGRNWGEEFVYPKARAIELAKETKETVLFTPAEITPEVAVAVKSPDEPVVVQLKQAPVMAIKPTGEEVAVAEVVTASAGRSSRGNDAGTAGHAAENGEPDAADRIAWIVVAGWRVRRPCGSQPTSLDL